MKKTRWVFCDNCGQVFKTSSITCRFCCKACMNEWISGNNMSSFGNISNSGYKDKKKYKKWRDSVIARYNNTCATCGVKEKSLHSHHIVPWSEDELLRYESENGVALCKNCHSIIHGFEIYCKKNILKDLNNIKNIRQKYVDVCNIKFKRG